MTFCVSCMSSNGSIDIFETHLYNGDNEIYSDMFKVCFNIEFSSEEFQYKICLNCAAKLRDAYHFMQQTINTKDILLSTREYIKQDTKCEVLKVQFLDDTKVEYLDDTLWDSSLEDGRFDEKSYDQSISDTKDSVLSILLHETKDNRADMKWKSRSKKREPMSKAPLRSKVVKKKEKSKRKDKIESPFTLGVDQTQCDICQEQFVMRKTLREHMSVHYPNHVCEECGKRFIDKRGLNRHKRCHVEGPFECNVCKKVFHNLNTLGTHKYLNHSVLKPFVCNLCKQRFSTFILRLNHQKEVHQVGRKYQCPHCEKKFYYSGARSRHVRSIHLRIRNFKCAQCPMAFAQGGGLRAHLAHAHGVGEKPHQCAVCLKRYGKANTLREHLRIHADDRRFKCENCNATFVQKCSLKSHEKRGVCLKVGFKTEVASNET